MGIAALDGFYLEGYFTPVENDEELEYGFGDISAVFPGMGGNRCSLDDGWFYWSAEEFMNPSVSSEGIHVQAGDAVFEVAYDVKPGVEVMKRNTPVTLDLAVIDEGSETGKEIRNITMDAYVRAGHELSVYKYITGNGNLNVSNIVIGSDEPLVFKIDNDVTTFCGTGNLIVDDEYQNIV